MSFSSNDYGKQGQLLVTTTTEAIDGQIAAHSERQGRFRSAGWWPSIGGVLKALLLVFLVIVAIGWTLTLLN